MITHLSWFEKKTTTKPLVDDVLFPGKHVFDKSVISRSATFEECIEVHGTFPKAKIATIMTSAITINCNALDLRYLLKIKRSFIARVFFLSSRIDFVLYFKNCLSLDDCTLNLTDDLPKYLLSCVC